MVSKWCQVSAGNPDHKPFREQHLRILIVSPWCKVTCVDNVIISLKRYRSRINVDSVSFGRREVLSYNSILRRLAGPHRAGGLINGCTSHSWSTGPRHAVG